jgi:hypothetical protein
LGPETVVLYPRCGTDWPATADFGFVRRSKNFNKYFKASKPINNGNVMKALDSQKLKGANSTVGTNIVDGTTKYFLTQAGITMAQKLAKGEAVTE